MAEKSDQAEQADKERARVEELLNIKQCLGCLHEGMIVTSADGTIFETTQTAEHILETPSTGLKGKDVHDFFTTKETYDEMLDQATQSVRALNRSLVVSTATGKRKLVNMSVQRTGDGADARFVHVFQDCADLRSMEEKLLQSERLATVGKFASQIAHEIRNPLNSISLNVELLEDELKDSGQEAKSLIRSVLRELDRLNDIISEYLQFARFPKPHLKRGRIDKVLEEIKAFKAPRNVAFHVYQPEATPEIWLDEGLLRQVIDNLIRNAVESIEGEGSITVETDILDRFLVIRVRDTGVGVPPEALPKLFEPFFTTKPQGTGLGLATSQQIIFEHNGHLVVESQPAKGSTFSILLPL
jgi:signal transduction histidine kinase